MKMNNDYWKQRFEKLTQEHIDTITRNEEKQQKIDKAIEYIKSHTDKLKTIRVPKIDFDYSELLEILGDKENEET